MIESAFGQYLKRKKEKKVIEPISAVILAEQITRFFNEFSKQLKKCEGPTNRYLSPTEPNQPTFKPNSK